MSDVVLPEGGKGGSGEQQDDDVVRPIKRRRTTEKQGFYELEVQREKAKSSELVDKLGKSLASLPGTTLVLAAKLVALINAQDIESLLDATRTLENCFDTVPNDVKELLITYIAHKSISLC